MPAAARDFSITYGSLTVGTAARPITGKIRTERNHEEFSLEFEFFTRAATAAAWATEIDAVEEAFRTPNQNFSVTGGDTVSNALWVDFRSTDTSVSPQDLGFNARPTILKTAQGHDTAFSRVYTVRIVCELEADLLGAANGRMGRRASTVSVAYTAARRRTVTISGTYTATSAAHGITGDNDSNFARNVYGDRISAYTTAVLTSVDSAAVWDLVDEPVTEVEDTDDTAAGIGQGKVIRFTRVFQEIISAQAGTTPPALADPLIVDQTISVTAARGNPGDDPGVARLRRAELSFECSIDKDILGTSGQPATLFAAWTQKIRKHVREAADDFFGGGIGGKAIIREEPQFFPDESRISCQLTMLGLASGTLPYEGTITTEDVLETGQMLVPAWAGHEHAKYDFQGPARRIRRVSASLSTPGLAKANPLPRFNTADNPPNARIKVLGTTHTPLRLGFEGNSFPATRSTIRVEIEYFAPIDAAGSVTPVPIGQNLDVVKLERSDAGFTVRAG